MNTPPIPLENLIPFAWFAQAVFWLLLIIIILGILLILTREDLRQEEKLSKSLSVQLRDTQDRLVMAPVKRIRNVLEERQNVRMPDSARSMKPSAIDIPIHK